MTTRDSVILLAFVLMLGAISGLLIAVNTLSRHNAMLAADYQDALASENHTTRSRTNYEFPRMGTHELRAITEVAQALEWPWELIAAIEKAENGGMSLELGAQRIPSDIKKNYPPYMWQRAAGARIMAKEAGRMIIEDPEVTYVFATRLAKRWGAKDVLHWREVFINSLNSWRGEGNVVRPDKKNKPKAARRKSR